MKRVLLGSSRSARRGRSALRVVVACALLALPLAARFVPVFAQATPPPPTGQSFLVLDPDELGVPVTPPRFTQELYATTQLDAFSGLTAKVLGGVAFAPNGDVWVAECLDNRSTLHRFVRDQYRDLVPSPSNHYTITPRVELSPVPTEVGCGIVNHPDGRIYSNNAATVDDTVSSAAVTAAAAANDTPYPGGVTRLDASTGLPVAWPDGSFGPKGPPGNALGIVTDPQNGHLIYAGDDCDLKGPISTTCTLWDLDPGTETTAPSATVFAQLPHVEMPFVDGIYFEPAGNYLFVTNRTDTLYETPAGTMAVNAITVLRRPSLVTPETPQVVRHIPMATEPDGISFHTGGQFLVTNDEEGRTMTRFDFPNGFAEAPGNARSLTVVDGNGDQVEITLYGAPFATDGFRGDLSQVGPDGCIYATQGRDFLITDLATRYDNGDTTTEDSIVKICATPGNGGFEPPPGVGNDPPASGSIEGSVYLDVDGNGVISAADTFLPDVTVTLAGQASATAPSSGGPVPAYSFGSLSAGSYSVSVPATAAGYALAGSTPASVDVTLARGEHRTGVDFLYVPGKLTGSVYFDANNDGLINAPDTFLANVPLTLSDGASSASGSGPAPAYTFPGLAAGSYTVTAPAVAHGYLRTIAPPAQTLAPGQQIDSLDFLYVAGRLSGYAYVDANDNHMMDAGEARLPSVTVTGPGGTTQTDVNGYYSFVGLAAGAHSVSAPDSAGGYARTTASPLSVTLEAGQSVADLNFGYRPGALSGYAYVDANGNGTKDSGETVLPGVGITLAGAASGAATTGATGAYAFGNLLAGGYTVSAPAAVGVYVRTTPAALSPTLPPGGVVPDLNFGYQAPPPPALGSISGRAYIDANASGTLDAGEVILGGVAITLSGAASAGATTATPAGYTFGNLASGAYSVGAAATTVYNGFTYNLTTPSPIAVALAAGEHRQQVDFGYRPSVVYTTYTQGGWGATPAGNNPGTVLQNNFTTVYSTCPSRTYAPTTTATTCVTIGTYGVSNRYFLRFTSAAAIRAFLPAGGAPKTLKSPSQNNPTSSAAGVFAGQVLAVQLAVDFSNRGVTAPGLAGLHIAPGQTLAGYTVQEALTLANRVLGGDTSALPAGVNVSALSDVMTRINENFDNGTTNNGFLVP